MYPHWRNPQVPKQKNSKDEDVSCWKKACDYAGLSDHHTQCQSYSTGSSKLASSSFFGSHFQSSKRFVLLGEKKAKMKENPKNERDLYC